MGALSKRSENSRYYGGFRGVDFSSDHTQVHDQRLVYLVNMYKDYQTSEGNALETIPGFRRRVVIPQGGEIYGVHECSLRTDEGVKKHVLIHAGARLYRWYNYPHSIGVPHEYTITLPDGEDITLADGTTMKKYDVNLGTLGLHVECVEGITKQDGEMVLTFVYDKNTMRLEISSSSLAQGNLLHVTYKEGTILESDALFDEMNSAKSTSFVFNNRLYLIDGKNFLYYDGETVNNVLDTAYIPTTYIGIIPSGENADIGTEYEQRNILQPKFKHTFVADGESKVFVMNERGVAIEEVSVYGKTVTSGYSIKDNTVSFENPPGRPEDNGFSEHYPGVVITASKPITKVTGVTESTSDVGSLITKCTMACVFDNRVFFSGNPDLPNHVFYCGRNLTGYTDPSYFGVLNYFQDGVENVPVTGMIPVADTLMVLKGDTQQDGMVFFHTPTETGEDLLPKIYPSKQGLHGVGCLGACVNFLDDPVFVSRLGVEAVGQLSVRNERAVEHRSSLVDAKLAECDLSRATLTEWDGYLLLSVDGKVFMADSRQKYANELGVVQYEWFYLEDIGVYQDQYLEYVYAERMEPGVEGARVTYVTDKGESMEIPLVVADNVYYADTDEYKDLRRTTANPADIDGNETGEVFSQVLELKSTIVVDEKDDEDTTNDEIIEVSYFVNVYFTVHWDKKSGYQALLCSRNGAHIGGIFYPATIMKSLDKNLFFGTQNGVLCSFNVDKREQGQIPARYYTFDDRAIRCGCATKLDNCGIPHLTKSTIKKSTVIKTRSLQATATKVKVRTNREPFQQIARLSSNVFTFNDLDFADFSFLGEEQNLFGVKEKEKKWVEKQYYVYSDEYMRPFSLYYIAYRYRVAGRYK